MNLAPQHSAAVNLYNAGSILSQSISYTCDAQTIDDIGPLRQDLLVLMDLSGRETGESHPPSELIEPKT